MTIEEFFKIISKRIVLILTTTVVVTAFLAAVTIFILPSKYKATSEVLVNGQGDTAAQIVTLQELIKSKVILNSVSNKLELISGYQTDTNTLLKNTNVQTNNGSPIFSISYQDSNPQKARYVSSLIAQNVIEKSGKYIANANLMIVSAANVNNTPVSPNVKSILVMAVVGGFVLGIVIAVIAEMRGTYVVNRIYANRILELKDLGKVRLSDSNLKR